MTVPLGARKSREEKYETFSQELQIGRSSRSIDWIVGLYYFHENNYARANGLFPPFLAPIADVYFQGGTLRTDAYAAFGELSYHVTPKMTVTLGGRYSDERKRIIDEFVYLRGPTGPITGRQAAPTVAVPCTRSEEHTSELQSLMRTSYAVFCLKNKN